MFQQNNRKNYKWATVFIELALRAIRRVHFEYGVWGIGSKRGMDSDRITKINMGPGIELADERTVCAAITQEYINSRVVSGLWKEAGGAEEVRFFEIDREELYKSGNKEKVDIVIKKILENGKRTDKLTFIEAKRACIWTANIPSGKVSQGSLQTKRVKDDIEKLRKEMCWRKKNKEDEIVCHLLVWGIWQNDNGGGSPRDFFEKCGVNNDDIHQLKWLPIEWKGPKSVDEDINFKVTKSIWIALAEVGGK